MPEIFKPPAYVPSPEAEAYHEYLDKFKLDNPTATIIAPQKGPQTEFCLSPANICIYGGAGGGGKTYGSLICALGTMNDFPGFDVTMFRKTIADAKKANSLIDETKALYLGDPLNAEFHGTDHRFTFPNGSTTTLAGMSMDKQLEAQKGGQYGGVVFDELTLFKKRMFFYMMTRIRSMSGGIPFIKATTNPQPEGWVKELLEEAGYLDKETGFAIYEMSGVLRWFYMGEDDKLVWFDSRKEALQWWKDTYPDQWKRYLVGRDWLKDNPGKTLTDAKEAGIDCRSLRDPLSFTFIPSTLSDNAKMLEIDPGYEARLENQPLEDRMALLYGCWKNFGNAGEYFKESMCAKIHKNELPSDMECWLGVDMGYTEKTHLNDPDYTAIVLMGKSDSTKRTYILETWFYQLNPIDVVDKIKAIFDKYYYDELIQIEGISLPEDPGGGKGNAHWMVAHLAGINVHVSSERGGVVSPTGRKVNPKLTRFLPFASQAQHKFVDILHQEAEEAQKFMSMWVSQLVGFPTGKNDDAVDATSRAFDRLTNIEKCYFGTRA